MELRVKSGDITRAKTECLVVCALADGQPPRFAGWPAHADEAACVAAFRSELMVLADGLEAWPALWELARDKAGQWLGALR